jgi:hypothetical protein
VRVTFRWTAKGKFRPTLNLLFRHRARNAAWRAAEPASLTKDGGCSLMLFAVQSLTLHSWKVLERWSSCRQDW